MESSLSSRRTEFTVSCQGNAQSLVWEIEDAQVTIDSIRRVLDSARTGSRWLTAEIRLLGDTEGRAVRRHHRDSSYIGRPIPARGSQSLDGPGDRLATPSVRQSHNYRVR